MPFLLLTAALSATPYVENPVFDHAAQDKALASTLLIVLPGSEGAAVRVRQDATGTYYLTALHIVTTANFANLEAFTAQSHPRKDHLVEEAEVIERWPDIDLVLFRSRREAPATCAPICPKDKTPQDKNMPVLTVGCRPGFGSLEIWADQTRGAMKLVHKPGQAKPTEMWQLQKVPPPGRSGGPAFDRNGYLIGICSGTDQKSGYYLHVAEIRKAIESRHRGALLGESPPPAEVTPKK